MRWVIGFLAAVLILAGIGDALARSVAEDRAAEHLRTALDLEAEPDVSFGGWPFMLNAVRGSFPAIDVGIDTVRARGVRLDDVTVTLESVKVDLAEILGGSAEGVRSEGGRGEAVLAEAELNRVVARAGAVATVRLEGDRAFVEVGGEEVPGELEVTGTELVIRGEGLPRALRIELPGVIDGLAYTDVDIRDSRAYLRFSLSPARLRAP